MKIGQFTRTELVLGHDAVERLGRSRIAVFGIGGVGGYAVEALVRSGIGTIDIIDNDTVDITNINRQIIALHSTLGMKKTDVMEKRILDINPEAIVNKHDGFYLPDNSDCFDFSKYDYIVDCIDTVTAKIDLAVKAEQNCIPIISSMGTGNKSDPSKLRLTDIYSTINDHLARVMRHELRKRKIESLKVVYSEEMPMTPDLALEEFILGTEKNKQTADASASGKRSIPGSTAFVPPAAGIMIAAEVVKDIISGNTNIF